MFRRYSVNLIILSIYLDAIFVMAALAIAAYLRPAMSQLPFTRFVPATSEPLVPLLLYPIFALVWVSILLLLSVYDARKNWHIVNELTQLTIGSLVASISLAGLLYLSYRDVSRFLFLFFALQAYLYLIAWRLVARLRSHLNKSQQKIRSVLIIGAGKVGLELHAQITQHPFMGLQVMGFLDDDPQKITHNKQILGPLSKTRAIVQAQQIDDVVIALPGRAYSEVSQLVAELHDLPVKIWVIPDYFHLALHKAQVVEFAGLPMFDLRAPALNDYQRLLKRGFDLLVTPLLLLIFSPIMLALAIAIKLDTPGPVLYISQRLGENGRLFKMYKFRSMIAEADQHLQDVAKTDADGNLYHKFPDDPRVTRVGRFTRKTSLDELPQFFNVLKGEMSLVGPRPEIPALVQNYEPWQRKRFVVPQGITGWWQINGRSDKPMHLHTEDDIYYIQNYSIFLDLFILLKTAWIILKGSGAY